MHELLRQLGLTGFRLIVLLGALIAWVSIIVFSGAGWNLFSQDWNFTNSGAFGDSFGPLSALMALVAAGGAIGAFRSQADEIRRVRAREQELDRISASDRARLLSRQIELDRLEQLRSFEGTFFKLLDQLRELVSSMDLVNANDGARTVGHDVFRDLLEIFKTEDLGGSKLAADIRREWPEFCSYYRNDLNHYFRLLYHIVRFISQSEVERRYFYAQILRASLSDGELSLLALNCLYGEGREKFKDLVERYALLHNLSDEEVRYWRLRSKYESGAFNYTLSSEEVFDMTEGD